MRVYSIIFLTVIGLFTIARILAWIFPTNKKMYIYKLNNLEFYTVAFNKKDAIITFLHNKIGVTEKDVIETDIEPNRDALGKVFKNLDELKNYVKIVIKIR